ncbi:MAG: carboxypeptidase regulatory-like domain-containing protein [Phycisphaerales bacterium]
MTLLRIAFLTLCFFTSLSCFAEDPPARADLHGVIVDESGKPVSGVTVYVWTAAVKTGYSSFCPSCYPDCGKRAETNDKGEFEIKSLDNTLKFELMVAKGGFAPTTKNKVDASSPTPVQIALKPRPPLPPDPDQTISGRIIDNVGKPIHNAMVSADMVYWRVPQNNSGGAGGNVEGLDKFAISDEKGLFTLACTQAAVAKWNLDVGARSFASRHVPGVVRTDQPQEFKLGTGGIVRGRLLQDGKPVPNAQMVLSHSTRTWGYTLGYERIGTNADGYFIFTNIEIGDFPPEAEDKWIVDESGPLDSWWLSATMNSLKGTGATPPQRIRVQKHGDEIDVGDVIVQPPLHIRGKVVTADGKPLPTGSRISINSEAAWDPALISIADDGSFSFDGLFPGDWILSPNVKGYNISPKNPSNIGAGVGGRIDASVDDLIILVDPKVERSNTQFGRPNQPFKSIDPTLLPAPVNP